MNHLKETILLVSLFLMNAAGFLVMFIDKQKARRGRWRIPERTLLLSCEEGEIEYEKNALDNVTVVQVEDWIQEDDSLPRQV